MSKRFPKRPSYWRAHRRDAVRGHREPEPPCLPPGWLRPRAVTRSIAGMGVAAALVLGVGEPVLEAYLSGACDVVNCLLPDEQHTGDVPHSPEPGPYNPGPAVSYTAVMATGPTGPAGPLYSA